jgi:hypothetical protein
MGLRLRVGQWLRKLADRLDRRAISRRDYCRDCITIEVCIDSKAAEEKLGTLKAEIESILKLSAKVNQ